VRKLDYQTTAQTLREELQRLNSERDTLTGHDAIQANRKAFASVEAIAYKLANKLHVDKSKFLAEVFK
jgi:hypothetical protein